MGRVSGRSFPPASQSWAEPVGEGLRESGAGVRVRGREGDILAVILYKRMSAMLYSSNKKEAYEVPNISNF